MRRMTLAVVLATVAGGVVALSPAVASAQGATTTVAPTSLVFDGQEVGTTSFEASVTVMASSRRTRSSAVTAVPFGRPTTVGEGASAVGASAAAPST